MIQLNRDSLIFETPAGNIPCSAELVTIELIGNAIALLDPEVVRNASAAVLHYFKQELGRESVSVGEFSEALEKVLRGFGLDVQPAEDSPLPRIAEADLRHLASSSGKGFELFFFANLRRELQVQLEKSPELVRFNGLRGCVKQLVGARRWTERCQELNDQIVEYLRNCLTSESGARSCALLVS